DWKTVDGQYVPHDLSHIAELKLGDCKDFSAATAAILKKLGLDAHIALTNRGVYYDGKADELPTESSFNHAIVYVKADERVYWIDPTNTASFAGGMFSDIADRP